MEGDFKNAVTWENGKWKVEVYIIIIIKNMAKEVGAMFIIYPDRCIQLLMH